MKLVILSDSHGNIVRLRHVLGFVEELVAGAIIHAGDWYRLVPEDFARVKNIPVYTALGNNDYRPELRDELRRANIIFSEDFLEFEIDTLNIGLSHHPPSLKLREDKPYSTIDRAYASGKYDVWIHGHTHKPKNEVIGKTRVLNPGALDRASHPTFAVYDTQADEVEFIDIAI